MNHFVEASIYTSLENDFLLFLDHQWCLLKIFEGEKGQGVQVAKKSEVGCDSNLLSWICLASLATFAELRVMEHSNKLGKRNLKKCCSGIRRILMSDSFPKNKVWKDIYWFSKCYKMVSLIEKFKFSNTFPRQKKKRVPPPKTNMEPENEPLEEEIFMKNHHF